MRPVRSILAALACLALTACGRTELPGTATTDSAGITLVTSTAPAWATDEAWRVGEVVTSIGTVDGPPEIQLHRVVGATRLDDGRVVVANGGSSEIRVYAPDGSWLRSMGGQGNGPGEFRFIRGLQLLPPDTLIVRDDRGPRVTRFTVDGELVDARLLPSPVAPFTTPTHRLPGGRWLLATSSDEVEGYQTRRNAFLTWTPGDHAVDTLLAGPGYQYLLYLRYSGDRYIGRGGVPVPFGGQDLTAIGPGRVALSDGGAYDIAAATLDGRRLRVRREVQRRPLTRDVVDRFVDDYVDRYPAERRDEVRDHFGSLTPPAHMPTHSGLMFDAAGRLWVEEYRPPDGADEPRTWSVFDPDGLWLGDVVLPDGLRVLEIGEDYVLGVERDELDVEYVRVYRVEK